MHKMFRIFLLSILLTSINAYADPIKCPDISMIKNAKFTEARFLAGIWEFNTQKFDYDNRSWDIVFMTIMVNTDYDNPTAALKAGQAYFDRFTRIKSPTLEQGSRCVYSELGEKYFIWASTPPWSEN